MLTRVQRILIASRGVQSLGSFLPSNQMYSLKQAVASFSGIAITVYNGSTSASFGFIEGDLNPAIDTHIDAGDGTKDVTFLAEQNGGVGIEWAIGSAPHLIKENDGTYSFDVPDGVYPINGVLLTGNLLNIVCNMNKASFILISQNGSTSRYIGVGQDGNTGGTTTYSGSPTLWDGNTQITNNRDVLHDTVNTSSFKALNYNGIVLYSSITYKLGGYGNGATGTTWTIKGKFKELSTAQTTTTQEAIDFIQESIVRNNIT